MEAERPGLAGVAASPTTDANIANNSSKRPQRPRYCCYGCRLLGENSQRPVSLTETPASPWFKIAIGAAVAGQVMLLGLAVNLTPPVGSARWLLHSTQLAATLTVLALLGGPLVRGALEQFRQRRLSIEWLFLAGILGALGASLQSSLSGSGPIYYEVVAILLTVYAIGKTLGARARSRALAEARQFERLFDKCTHLDANDVATIVPVAEVVPGDRVLVRAGEAITVDGRILAGQAFVCETPLTGEPFPVVRRPGDLVLAGSYAEDGELRIRAEAGGTERRLDRLLHILEQARSRPCRIQATADHIVRWFLPLVLAISLGTFAWWTRQANWSVGLLNALSVLLVACPCAMGLATPVALWSGMAALAARGLVAGSGDDLDRLAELDRMVFDKTGTLSKEQFSLVDLVTLDSALDCAGSVPGGRGIEGGQGDLDKRATIVAQLCAVEAACSHPVARAFHGLSGRASEYEVRSTKTIPALGVEAWLVSITGAEHFIRIGQRDLTSNLANEARLLSQLRHSSLAHLVYVEVDGELRAVAAVNEWLRASAADAVAGLQQQGVLCEVMTGDRAGRARQLLQTATGPDVNQSPGLPSQASMLNQVPVQGGLSAEEKAARVSELVAAGHRVGFVGDGVNDAPAMQQASLGIALASGASVTVAGANVVLHGGDLRVLAWAVALARRVQGAIRSNLIFAAAYNLTGMGLAAAGLLHPVAAALLMVVSSFTVSWRALRSVEAGEDCCAVSQPIRPVQPVPQAARVRSRFQLLSAWLIVAQAPFLVYLAQARGLAAGVVWAGTVGLSLLVARWRAREADWRRWGQMTIAMFGLGNWGMLLGWWADAGFRPIESVSACCAASGFSLWSFCQMPWMSLGMLALGLPPMLTGPSDRPRGLNRFAHGALAAAGMVWGMSYGHHVALKWLAPLTSEQVLVSWLGMVVGMMVGMFLACEFGRALSLAWRK